MQNLQEFIRDNPNEFPEDEQHPKKIEEKEKTEVISDKERNDIETVYNHMNGVKAENIADYIKKFLEIHQIVQHMHNIRDAWQLSNQTSSPFSSDLKKRSLDAVEITEENRSEHDPDDLTAYSNQVNLMTREYNEARRALEALHFILEKAKSDPVAQKEIYKIFDIHENSDDYRQKINIFDLGINCYRIFRSDAPEFPEDTEN